MACIDYGPVEAEYHGLWIWVAMSKTPKARDRCEALIDLAGGGDADFEEADLYIPVEELRLEGRPEPIDRVAQGVGDTLVVAFPIERFEYAVDRLAYWAAGDRRA